MLLRPRLSVMPHKHDSESLGPKAAGELHQTSSNVSKSEALQRIFDSLTIEQFEAVVRARGMDNDSEMMHILKGIRRGSKIEALERSISENRDPTLEELEAALQEVALDSDPESARQMTRLRNKDRIVRAEKLIQETLELLTALRKAGGEMEIEAVSGFYEMARLAIDALNQCNEESIVSVAEKKIHWPVMAEPGGNAKRETIESELKQIKLGTRTSSQVRVNAVLTQPSRHKFVITNLYWTVQATHTLDRLAHLADKHPERIAQLRADMDEKYKMLMKSVDGYEANEWRDQDRKKFAKAIKNLRKFPEVNAASFNEWFAACLALLDCITHGEFHHARYKLRNLGEARAQKREGLESDYRDGITGALKSTLKTVLKIPRKKVG